MDRYKLVTDFNTIYICNNIIKTMQQYIQINEHMSEAGGILAGRIFTDDSWEIAHISTPQPNDRRFKYSFHRSSDHQKYIKSLWRNRGKEVTLLGTWHTHLEAYPNPSSTDLADWIYILEKSKYHKNNLVFMIAGLDSIRTWLGNRQGKIIFLGEINVGSDKAYT